MDVLVELGKIAGIAGICVGAFTLIFRDVIRKKIFPTLPAGHAYRLLRLIIVCAWSIALIGIVLWQLPVIVAGDGNVVIRDAVIKK